MHLFLQGAGAGTHSYYNLRKECISSSSIIGKTVQCWRLPANDSSDCAIRIWARVITKLPVHYKALNNKWGEFHDIYLISTKSDCIYGSPVTDDSNCVFGIILHAKFNSAQQNVYYVGVFNHESVAAKLPAFASDNLNS